MNLDRAINLLNIVSVFELEVSENKPNFSIYDNQKEGLSICVKANLVDKELSDYLLTITESRRLRIHELEGYLIIQTVDAEREYGSAFFFHF